MDVPLTSKEVITHIQKLQNEGHSLKKKEVKQLYPDLMQTMLVETSYHPDDVKKLASYVYASSNQAARISSGSFRVDGMVILPCSMKTLAAIRIGLADSLIPRAADVILKERKKLVILPRELPLNSIHLENMLSLSNAGAVILPPMLTFYNKPSTLDDAINHIVARTMEQFEIENELTKRWLSH